jgi:hypothetical protein
VVFVILAAAEMMIGACHVLVLCRIELLATRKLTVAAVQRDRCMRIDDDLPDNPESVRRDAAADAADKDDGQEEKKNGRVCASDLDSLDAVQVTCVMPDALKMLIPASALRFHAGKHFITPHPRPCLFHGTVLHLECAVRSRLLSRDEKKCTASFRPRHGQCEFTLRGLAIGSVHA